METKRMRLMLMALAGILALGLAACGDDDDDGTTPGDDDDDDDTMMMDAVTPAVGLFVPEAGGAADMGGTPPGAPFDTSATYIGAEQPGTAEGEEWWAGWVNLAADDAAPATCTPVDADITSNTTWSDDCYQLTGVRFVRGGATLTIDPGVFIVGTAGTQTALVVTTEGRLEAVGTADEPIVFTSDQAPGSRSKGDIGGLVMLGLAEINVPGGTDNIEGLNPGLDTGSYGGTDNAHDCGTLRYVRVEFAGFVFGADNELNAITLGGCGSQTELDFVQASFGLDDGIEFFGGRPQLRHAVVNGVDDDHFDFDQGYVGTVQFGVIYNSEGDRGFEWDNNGDGRLLTPFTDPTLWNVTVVGENGDSQEGLRLREGVRADLNNLIVQDFANDQCVEVQHVETKAQVESGDLALRNSILANCETAVRFSVGDSCTDAEPTCPVAAGITDTLTCPADGTADEYDCVLDGDPFTPPWLTDSSFGNTELDQGIVSAP